MDFRLLGQVQAISAGRSLALGERKRRLVLAILLLDANRVVPIDRLVQLIWQDDPPDTARRIVQAHVSRLRGILGGAAAAGDGHVSLERHGPGYLLTCDAQRVDIHAFRHLVDQARSTSDDQAKTTLLRRALALWRGPVLADVITARVRHEVFASLEEARLTAVTARIDAELRLGRHVDLLDELTGLVAQYPDRQPFAAQLMLALFRAGRVPDAAAVYRRTSGRLRQEYGLDPSPELTELHVAILRADPGLHLSAPTCPCWCGRRPGGRYAPSLLPPHARAPLSAVG
jgi:DNA-binding SARP family transcriptional activator